MKLSKAETFSAAYSLSELFLIEQNVEIILHTPVRKRRKTFLTKHEERQYIKE